MKKLLPLILLLTSAAAAPVSGGFGTAAKSMLTVLYGKSAPCKDPALVTSPLQVLCANVPMNASAFKSTWGKVGEKQFKGIKLENDWKADTDPTYKGAFSRVYSLGGKPLVVYYQPTGTTGHLSLIYSGPASSSAAPSPTVKFRSCAAALAAGYSNMRQGQPGYSPNLDRDNDGIACDK